MTLPLAPCIVWRCARVTVDASGTFCERHAADAQDALERDADALYALTMAEGLTLAQIDALT